MERSREFVLRISQGRQVRQGRPGTRISHGMGVVNRDGQIKTKHSICLQNPCNSKITNFKSKPKLQKIESNGRTHQYLAALITFQIGQTIKSFSNNCRNRNLQILCKQHNIVTSKRTFSICPSLAEIFFSRKKPPLQIR